MKNLLKLCLILCVIAIATFAIDFGLFKLMFVIDGTPIMLIWYASLFLIPLYVHFITLKFFLFSNKKIALFIAVCTTFLMQSLVYHCFLLLKLRELSPQTF